MGEEIAKKKSGLEKIEPAYYNPGNDRLSHTVTSAVP